MHVLAATRHRYFRQNDRDAAVQRGGTDTVEILRPLIDKVVSCKARSITGRTVCSPDLIWTVRRTIIRFLIELLVRRTWFGQFDELCFVLNCAIMRCKLRPELVATRSRQHDPKCRLKSSQVKSIYFDHPSQGNSTNYYVIRDPRNKAAPTTGQFPPKQLKYRYIIHFYFYFFLIHRRALFALNQSEAMFAELANIPRIC